MEPTCPAILTYHSISDGPPPLCIRPPVFAKQMSWLRANAHVASLSDVIEFIAARKPLPPRTVALTFDDGFADFYSNVAAVLQDLGLTATVFVTTGYSGRYNDWPSQPAGVCRRQLLDWLQVRELSDLGFSIGSHSISHPNLTRLSAIDLAREVSGSRRELENRIGQSVQFFCYPYGITSASVRKAVELEYRGACGVRLGLVKCGSDIFELPRIDAYYLRHPAVFSTLFSRYFETYMALRQAPRSIRAACRFG